MKEFIDKLIERLEEKRKFLENTYLLSKKSYEVKKDAVARINELGGAIEIVNELAEEYINTSTEHINCSTDTSTISKMETVGWIPCSERLPEEKENPITHDYMQYPVMVNIGGTVDLRYYYYGNGHWRLGFQIMDEYVAHWMDIAPYTEGE